MTRYDVILTHAGPNKIQAIKAVCMATTPPPGLKEAKDLVENPPATVLRGGSRQQARAAMKQFTQIGATVQLRPQHTRGAAMIRIPRLTMHEIIIKDTHRGLRYEDGKLTAVLGAGRYTIPPALDLLVYRLPKVEIVLVDMRERDLTIKGQEILTADKVAIRVSIVVQFRITDPRAALQAVASYEERIYTDVQLAARRSLASMNLEEILTNRNRLSEDILNDVKEIASGYGVEIGRADVKDLIFPGNLQEIMNRVLAAERKSQAQLIEARTEAEVRRINAEAQAEIKRAEANAEAERKRREAEAAAEMQRIQTEADIAALRQREQAASAYSRHPALLRLIELETLREMARIANARIYLNFNGQPGSSTLAREPERDDEQG